MYKKLLTLLITFVFMFTFMYAGNTAAAADDQPVVYESTITVTADGGSFQVGFVTLKFKKDFIDSARLPVTFDVKVFAKSGDAGVQVEPSTSGFLKDVQIRVDSYNGLLYDEVQGRNIQVNVRKQHLTAEHFSWYRFRS